MSVQSIIAFSIYSNELAACGKEPTHFCDSFCFVLFFLKEELNRLHVVLSFVIC